MTLSADDFELLLQANRILSSKIDVDDVLHAVMELATKVVKADASSLLLLDEKTNELVFDVALGSAKDRVKQTRIKIGEGIAGWVAREQKPLIVNDVSKDPRFTGHVDKKTRFQTRSILAVPLISNGQLIGVVEAINKKNGQDFSQGDLEAFSIFASQSAIAIQNARLFSALRREKEKLDTVFSQMSDGVIYVDEDERVQMINTSAGDLLALKRREVVSRPFSADLLRGFDITPPFSSLKGLTAPLSLIELNRRKTKDLFLMLQVHKFESGWLMIVSNITEEKKEENLKRNFLSLISHKLKTPLTVIMGYIPMLNTDITRFSTMQKKAVGAISAQGDHLNGLVDKLLKFALVESDHVKVNIEKHSLYSLLRQSVDALKDQFEEQHVHVALDVKENSTLRIYADSFLVTEVFKNFLENAGKFNDKDKKEIRISAIQLDDMISIHIEDNGRGIPSEEKAKIFQKFYQIENDFTGQVPGAGLGLAFCKKVTGEMRGRIDVESTLGKGTRIVVSFPGVPV